MEVTLGGDRLGSGQKQKVELHNYMMNSFNLEQDWKSSMAPGILYPCLKLIGTNHGTFDIDADVFCRTIPTKGPLFGSYKMQVDFFSVPIRLYQGILHNNPVELGMNMNRVYLPKLVVGTKDGEGAPRVSGSNEDNWQINDSALLKYLGLSGLGRSTVQNTLNTIYRKFQCVPILAYYDIFKCYYSNKQEEKAYVITPGTVQENETSIIGIQYNGNVYDEGDVITAVANTMPLKIIGDNLQNYDQIEIVITYYDSEEHTTTLTKTLQEIIDENRSNVASWLKREDNQEITPNLILYIDHILTSFNKSYVTVEGKVVDVININRVEGEIKYSADINLRPFSLKNIDDMRNAILNNSAVGAEFQIGPALDWDEESGTDETGLPYSALFKTTTEGITWNAFIDNGLVTKTYQSDLFNNWLNNTYVDQITNLTKVDTTGNAFTIDTLILQEKIYELTNRILVAGGTYQDWQDAVYGEGAVRMCETPMYIGGMSAEVMFEEVINNSESNVNGNLQPLGALGGKGTVVGTKGGKNIHVKLNEPGYVMAIVSLTPRICYTQGNDWDLTELDTIDDLHKPGLDGIGFQDIMAEQLAWWNTAIRPSDQTIYHRSSIGKQIAWINYQTAIDKAYGDFARTGEGGQNFMVLSRGYEHKNDNINAIRDVTTYIDPAKFNYAFAYSKLDAQNFWVQLHFKVIARRKMGAQQLPNL